MPHTRELNLNQARAFVEQGRGAVIDVLPPEHFEGRHLPGALNACVYEIVFAGAVAELAPDKEAPLLLYGAGPGSRDTRAAAEKLEDLGYKQVSIFPGGLDAWREARLALEGSRPDEQEPPHPPLIIEPREYRLLPEESTLLWMGRNYNSRHVGSVGFKSGVFSGSDLSGETVLNMASIKNHDLEGDDLQPVLENHLASDDFFFVKRFPNAVINISAAERPLAAATQPNFDFSGTLELKGLKKKLAFPGHLRNVGEAGEQLALMAHFDLDRTEWGIIYGSARFFQHLSYHVVFDLISIEVRAVLA